MGNYRNFALTAYFVAGATEKITKDELQKQIDFFKKYMRIDKIYLEAFRDRAFASEEQVRMVKKTFEDNGIKVEGGITTAIPTPEKDEEKQRLFNTFCYNDPKMLETLRKASELNGKIFDAFIIDDFYFTNCTCEACRKGRDEFNKENGIEDGSWQEYRMDLLYKVSEKYMIAPAKAVNPDIKITIKYPNWMESYQETGYNPLKQRDIFEYIYTGTETRDPRHTDQHLPRYLSYSLMGYMEDMAPTRNGGGWFDPFDCQLLEYYLEQAYLTAFSKPRELMMFCFQALYDSMNVPALGFQLDKLDEMLDNLGKPVGIPAYIPNASQGEDNVQDFLGMNGFPIVTTPFFPDKAATLLLTASSACDEDIISKLEDYVSKGGKAVVTSGFIRATLGKGIEKITSIRDRDRHVCLNEFMIEKNGKFDVIKGEETEFQVMEFRNNSTWGALVKGLKNEESYTLLARDTYGLGEMLTLVIPDSFPDLGHFPKEVLSRLRKEFEINGIYMSAPCGISLFAYDNDTFVLYNYVTSYANDADVYIHIKDAKSISVYNNPWIREPVKPLYEEKGYSVFRLRSLVGKFASYKINR